MLIGERLREIRESKNLSQGDIEKRCGLLRCYISRVENGHTVPAIETLEKLARALEVALYQLFKDGQGSPTAPTLRKLTGADGDGWGNSGRDARTLARFRQSLSRTSDRDRKILLAMAMKMARRGSITDRGECRERR